MTVTATLPRILTNSGDTSQVFAIELATIETDECGAPWVAQERVTLPPGEAIDLTQMVEKYSHDHKERHRILSLTEVGKGEEF